MSAANIATTRKALVATPIVGSLGCKVRKPSKPVNIRAPVPNNRQSSSNARVRTHTPGIGNSPRIRPPEISRPGLPSISPKSRATRRAAAYPKPRAAPSATGSRSARGRSRTTKRSFQRPGMPLPVIARAEGEPTRRRSSARGWPTPISP